MACESCKIFVKEELEKMGLHPLKVELGEADLKEKLSTTEQKQFGTAIKKAGLELVKTKEGVLIPFTFDNITFDTVELNVPLDDKLFKPTR